MVICRIHPNVAEMYTIRLRDGEFDIVSGKKAGRKGKRTRILYSLLFHLLFKNIGEIRDMENAGNYSLCQGRQLMHFL